MKKFWMVLAVLAVSLGAFAQMNPTANMPADLAKRLGPLTFGGTFELVAQKTASESVPSALLANTDVSFGGVLPAKGDALSYNVPVEVKNAQDLASVSFVLNGAEDASIAFRGNYSTDGTLKGMIKIPIAPGDVSLAANLVATDRSTKSISLKYHVPQCLEPTLIASAAAPNEVTMNSVLMRGVVRGQDFLKNVQAYASYSQDAIQALVANPSTIPAGVFRVYTTYFNGEANAYLNGMLSNTTVYYAFVGESPCGTKVASNAVQGTTKTYVIPPPYLQTGTLSVSHGRYDATQVTQKVDTNAKYAYWVADAWGWAPWGWDYQWSEIQWLSGDGPETKTTYLWLYQCVNYTVSGYLVADFGGGNWQVRTSRIDNFQGFVNCSWICTGPNCKG